MFLVWFVHFCILHVFVTSICVYLRRTIRMNLSPFQRLLQMLWFFCCWFSSSVFLHTSFNPVFFSIESFTERTRYETQIWQWLYELWLVFREMDMFMLLQTYSTFYDFHSWFLTSCRFFSLLPFFNGQKTQTLVCVVHWKDAFFMLFLWNHIKIWIISIYFMIRFFRRFLLQFLEPKYRYFTSWRQQTNISTILGAGGMNL